MTGFGRHIEIRGTVQGVGFRPWVYQVARRNRVAGFVRNDSRGVVIDAFGPEEALDTFLRTLETDAPPAARVEFIESSEIPWRADPDFRIDASLVTSDLRVSIPADLATCGDCLRETLDPVDRRYRYPFTNCTNCGPRYSIVSGAPYDRPLTSMHPFAMCEDCQREYDDPLDRRFHAQPNACPACGPRLVALTSAGREVSTFDPINFAARSLRAGLVVAIKGLGGFHLAVDAQSGTAVARLRERKRREGKPLAVLVADLEAAAAVAVLSDTDRGLLVSAERPIVLVPLRRGALAAGVCEPLGIVGLFLPYTPLHHLLARDAGMPLVMTSGNISDEPMVTTTLDALDQLGEVADVMLVHDRDIVTRVDDSVVRVIAGAPAILRRARGYVPRAIAASREFTEPILGTGAQLKNSFCIASGNQAFLGPHIGDLETARTLRDYESAIARMKDFTGAQPRVVAHDMHPDYFSTRYAMSLEGVQRIAVQHHHAHIVSAMAEHRLDGPVVGVAYDGTGYGTDGTMWGGEILIARCDGYDRFATFRPIALAGGDQAIRQPWRIALALLDDAYHGDAPTKWVPLFDRAPVDAVRRMIAAKFNTPSARGLGRLFDAFASLFLGIDAARYEGELAMRWESIADPAENGRYPVVVHEGQKPWEIDPRPIVRAAVEDMRSGRSAAAIAARFHNTIAAATTSLIRTALSEHGGQLPVVLSGGCFQNLRLTESIAIPDTFINRSVPMNDGGIALGQVFVADAILRAGRPVSEEAVACA
jgi:hydrogenase maturation protein HypF